MNNDFLVTREVICQSFSLVTSSLVKIIGKSPHSWQKIVIHCNSCIILYIPFQTPVVHWTCDYLSMSGVGWGWGRWVFGGGVGVRGGEWGGELGWGWDGGQLRNGYVAFYNWYRDQNEAPAKDHQNFQHSLLGGHEVKFSWDDHTEKIVSELGKLTDKMDKFDNHVEIINPGVRWKNLFLYLWVLLLHFPPAPSLKPAEWMEQGQSRMFWCI